MLTWIQGILNWISCSYHHCWINTIWILSISIEYSVFPIAESILEIKYILPELSSRRYLCTTLQSLLIFRPNHIFAWLSLTKLHTYARGLSVRQEMPNVSYCLSYTHDYIPWPYMCAAYVVSWYWISSLSIFVCNAWLVRILFDMRVIALYLHDLAYVLSSLFFFLLGHQKNILNFSRGLCTGHICLSVNSSFRTIAGVYLPGICYELMFRQDFF